MGAVLSLQLPNLAIDRLRRQQRRSARNASGRERARPVLLVRSERGRQVVMQACHESQCAGVNVGMNLSHARALLPHEVLVQTHQPEHDERLLHALAQWAMRFTPVVQADPPNGLLLEITGCAHLFGGIPAMLREVVKRVNQLGFQARAAIAPTVGSAWALARYGPANTILESQKEIAEALAPLPVRALRIEEEIETALRAVAVETIGQLMQLSRASLADRFGHSLLLRLDQARGQAFEPVMPLPPHEPVQVERVFDGPVKQLEGILQTGRELLDALCGQLAQHEAGVQVLQLVLERIDTHNLHETFTLSRPTRNAKHLWALLRPYLEQVHLGFGIERITLTAATTARLPHAQAVAADWRHDSMNNACDRQVGEVIDRLKARFGSRQVRMIQVKSTHVPERAFAYLPLRDPEVPQHTGTSLVHADRPTLLHDRARPVQVMLLSPDGPVMTMSRGGRALRILSSIGPERITPRWWLVGADARSRRRAIISKCRTSMAGGGGFIARSARRAGSCTAGGVSHA